MTIWFVSRHPGALEWAKRKGITYDHQVVHLDPAAISAGDRVIGSLPVNLAAEVCARGADFWNISMRLKPTDRGRELSADDLEGRYAEVERFEVRRIP